MTTTLPLTYPMTIYPGTVFKRAFRWRPGGGAGRDFTGWSARMYIGAVGKPPVLSLLGPSSTLALSSDGRITIQIEPDQTLLLRQAVYQYVLDVIDDDGEPIRFARGRITVAQDPGPL